MLRTVYLFIITSCVMLTLSACYRMPVVQGNELTEQQVHSIHQGMSQSVVIEKLGSPALQSVFPERQLTYIYTFRPVHGKMSQKQLILSLKSGRVSDIKFSIIPNEATKHLKKN